MAPPAEPSRPSPLVGLWGALRFLTRIPLPAAVQSPWEAFGQALPWFPAAGLILGIILASADVLLRAVFSPLVASVLLVALLLALSGALHADGLMDTADAVFAPVSPERRLEIMRDPHSGSFGVAALVVVLLLKVAAVAALPPAARAGTLVLAPVLGRWAIVLGATLFPYGRAAGLGAPLRASATWRNLALATLLPALLGVALGLWGITILLAAGLGAWLLGRWLMRKLLGLTGDCYGALCEVIETVTLLLAAPLAAALA